MENKKQFIYVLKPIPSLLKEENWTTHEEEIVQKHFNKLQKLLSEGKLILAGKTDGLNSDTFGIVILEVDNKAEAEKIMLADPAVVEGIMTAVLYPYNVALIQNRKPANQ
ncbi:MAG: hypothetical protein JEZ00_12550 [Anaerolineaceae bacterium]|nr:hypothetical protein [Anaerolineaceae bacterium]